MTRDDFMSLVYSELCDDSDNCRANRIIDAADDYAYDTSKWISVKERLPASDGRYLVSIRGANGIYVGISYYSKALSSKWIFHNDILGDIPIGGIVAWRMLPEPYIRNESAKVTL